MAPWKTLRETGDPSLLTFRGSLESLRVSWTCIGCITAFRTGGSVGPLMGDIFMRREEMRKISVVVLLRYRR